MTESEVTETRERNLSLIKGAMGTRPEPAECPGLRHLESRCSYWKGTERTRDNRRMFHALDYYCDVARWAAAGGQGEAPRLELTGTLFSDGKMPREAVEVAAEAARLVRESK